MRVFITGATGFIGTAVTRDLIAAGHRVLGLVRSDASAAALARLGGEPQRGRLQDLDVLAAGARDCDGVIHLGFVHDGASLTDAAAPDMAAIRTFGDALAGSGKPFVGTSGTMLLTPGRVGTEDDAADAAQAPAAYRVPAEEAVLALAARGVRASVVRPAPTVHGEGEHGFVPMLIQIARDTGVSAYVGDGTNRWPAVHRLDAARLFALAVERGEAGRRYHAVGEEGVPFRDIATAIGRHLGVPVVAKSPHEAAAHFGWVAFVAGVDNPTSNALTRARLGWDPTGPGLIADIDAGHYFAA